MLYKIYSGLAGGFGGATLRCVENFDTVEEAEDFAYECACEEYDSMAGLHGLRSLQDIMEEEGATEDEAEEYYNEDRESWLDYYVKPYYGSLQESEDE